MIICMFSNDLNDVVCITNRKICDIDFLERIKLVAARKPYAIILREKDMTPDEYEKLAVKVKEICDRGNVTLILHTFYKTAIRLGIKKIHMPLQELEKMPPEDIGFFEELGASCHSVEDAKRATALGCAYVIAGHIFATDCKKDLPPRGIEFLKEVVKSVDIPVYAIGGIRLQDESKRTVPADSSNMALALGAGAKKVCIMSGLMSQKEPSPLTQH